jgi:hypothetical protein
MNQFYSDTKKCRQIRPGFISFLFLVRRHFDPSPILKERACELKSLNRLSKLSRGAAKCQIIGCNF